MKQDIIPSMNLSQLPRLLSMPSLFNNGDWMDISESMSGLSMSEDDNNIYVEAALPGIDIKDVEVTFDKGVLWIRGQSKEEDEDKKRKFYRKASRSFSYRTLIPDTVDEVNEPKVISKNGLIKVTFAKIAKSEPKKLAVKAE